MKVAKVAVALLLLAPACARGTESTFEAEVFNANPDKAVLDAAGAGDATASAEASATLDASAPGDAELGRDAAGDGSISLVDAGADAPGTDASSADGGASDASGDASSAIDAGGSSDASTDANMSSDAPAVTGCTTFLDVTATGSFNIDTCAAQSVIAPTCGATGKAVVLHAASSFNGVNYHVSVQPGWLVQQVDDACAPFMFSCSTNDWYISGAAPTGFYFAIQSVSGACGTTTVTVSHF